MIRVKLLSAGRIGALALFISIAVALALYLLLRNRPVESLADRPKLQGKVVAVFNNTRYAHEVEGKVRFLLTAGTDKTYEDGTHELEQVKLESFGSDASRHDLVTSDRAKVSDPSNLNRLDAEFISNVVVRTSEELVVKTSYLHYDHGKNTVETNEPVEFEKKNLAGRSTGMIIEATDERIHLLKDVDVTIKPEEKAKGDKAVALSAKKPTRIQSASALLERKEHRVTFDGGVVVTQIADEMRASRMVGHIDAANRIERIEARGNSYLRQADRAEIKSADMDFFFGPTHQLARAVASGGAYTRSLGPPPLREARAATIEAVFVEGAQGNIIDTIKAQTDAVVQMHAPATDKANQADKTNPAERELTAGTVVLGFYPDGRNIKSAEATENAVMKITPVRAERGVDKKTIRAPKMSAAFYAEGNRVKTFNAGGGVRVEIEATVADAHPPRVTTSQSLAADFIAESQDVAEITQEGDFKYNEGDRNAVAERAVYDGPKEVLILRGKRPQAWDAKSRTQADEIDYDRKRDESRARGDVRTTYYSRESAGDTTPFKNTKSPVFITAERADARNQEGVAVYTGNARGWQDDNFVKADRIELYQGDKRMVATGHVESALYQVKRTESPGKQEAVPGFATADRMTYSDADRLVHYDGSVKARQGTDRIESEVIDVYLKKETNEVDRMTAERNVVLVQPGRRGTGDKLAYTAEDGRAILTGRTARVDDVEKGTTMGAQLTFYSRDDKIFVENQQGTGRVRSSHRLTKNKEN